MPQDEQPRPDVGPEPDAPAPGTTPPSPAPTGPPADRAADGETPPASPPASPSGVEGQDRSSTPRPKPPPSGVPRGTHIAWARLERPRTEAHTPTQSGAGAPPAKEPAPHQQPPAPPRPAEHPPPGPSHPPAATSAPAAQTSPVGEAAIVERPGHDRRPNRQAPPPAVVDLRDADVPSALGRLLAIVVTVGLGWALAVAIGLWLVVFLISRLA